MIYINKYILKAALWCLLFWVIILLLMGCSHSDRTEKPDTKELFSLWTNDTDVLSLQGMTFWDSYPFNIYQLGGVCECLIDFDGDQMSGTYAINCAASACNALSTTGSYSKTRLELTMMPASGPAIIYQ